MARFKNMSLRWKLLGAFGVVLALTSAVGFVGWKNTADSVARSGEMYEDVVVHLAELAQIREALYELRLGGAGQAYATANEQRRAEIRASDERWLKVIEEQMQAVAATEPEGEEKAVLTEWEATYPDFLRAREQTLALTDQGRSEEATALRTGETTRRLQQALAANDRLITLHRLQGDELNGAMSSSAERSVRLVLGILAAALAIGFGVAFLLAHSITGAVGRVGAAARALAQGDLDQQIELRSQDEIGQMAATFREMIAYQQRMAEVAGRMADGDLSVEVIPASERDVLGQAFRGMIVNLRGLVGQMQASANGLTETSALLGATAEQTGSGVGQVTSAVQSVAAGSQDTSRSAQTTQEAVAQLAEAIDGIARGASEQTSQVQAASTTATEIAVGVERVAGDAQKVARTSEGARNPHTSAPRPYERRSWA